MSTADIADISCACPVLLQGRQAPVHPPFWVPLKLCEHTWQKEVKQPRDPGCAVCCRLSSPEGGEEASDTRVVARVVHRLLNAYEKEVSCLLA